MWVAASDLEFYIDVDQGTGREMVMVNDTQQVGGRVGGVGGVAGSAPPFWAEGANWLWLSMHSHVMVDATCRIGLHGMLPHRLVPSVLEGLRGPHRARCAHRSWT